MKVAIATILTLVGLAVASPAANPESADVVCVGTELGCKVNEDKHVARDLARGKKVRICS